MNPEIVVGFYALVGAVIAALATFFGGVLRNRSERRVASSSAAQADLAARFDDASELAKYIDTRVEAAVAPLRQELKKVKADSREIQDAFRTWVSSVWLWNQRGRNGELPMPPTDTLSRLGLAHFVDEWPTEPPRTTRASEESS